MIRVCLLPQCGLRLVRVEGSASLTETMQFLVHRGRTTSAADAVKMLVDLRDMQSHLRYADISKITDFLQQMDASWFQGRMALLAASVVQYGTSRMFATLIGPLGEGRIRVCRSVEEAAGWLDAPLAEIVDGIEPGQWEVFPPEAAGINRPD